MNKVSESIWSNKNKIVVPMAEVSHVNGQQIVFKHSKFCSEGYGTDSYGYQPSVWLSEEDTKSFLSAWTFYRHELEGGSEGFKGPNE